MITNNLDLYNYMRDKGEWTTLLFNPSNKWDTDEIVIAFPDTFNMSVCGNRFNVEKIDDYKKECEKVLEWFEASERVIVITNVCKFGTPYMKLHAPELYKRLKGLRAVKQVINTKNIGELINPHRLQIWYKGIEPIKFDEVKSDNIIDSVYRWTNGYGERKKQQTHYINVINASHDKYERRKLRYVPEYTLFSQLFKKLFTK